MADIGLRALAPVCTPTPRPARSGPRLPAEQVPEALEGRGAGGGRVRVVHGTDVQALDRTRDRARTTTATLAATTAHLARVPRGAATTAHLARVPRGAATTAHLARVPRGAATTAHLARVPRGAATTAHLARVPRGAPCPPV